MEQTPEQQMMAMKLHETIIIRVDTYTNYSATRVPGGWLYTRIQYPHGEVEKELTPVYVPEPYQEITGIAIKEEIPEINFKVE